MSEDGPQSGTKVLGEVAMREYDVIVIGGGGSGLAAAIEARNAGRDVVLLEKNPALGGSTARAFGVTKPSSTKRC